MSCYACSTFLSDKNVHKSKRVSFEKKNRNRKTNGLYKMGTVKFLLYWYCDHDLGLLCEKTFM